MKKYPFNFVKTPPNYDWSISPCLVDRIVFIFDKAGQLTNHNCETVHTKLET